MLIMVMFLFVNNGDVLDLTIRSSYIQCLIWVCSSFSIIVRDV